MLCKALGGCFNCSDFERNRRRLVAGALRKGSILKVVPADKKGSLYCRLPTLLLSNVAVIISPLMSLVGSRISDLQRVKVTTTCLGDALSERRFLRLVSSVHSKRLGLLCVTPRQVSGRSFVGTLHFIGIPLLIISRTRYVSR